MSDLRQGLGRHYPRKTALPEHGLTLHELGELTRRAGIDAGFVVESEFKVQSVDGGKVRKLDWAWLSPKSLAPVVAIEVEGHGVYPSSLAADIAKFRDCGAAMTVVALFQIDHNRTLMKAGGIEEPKKSRGTPCPAMNAAAAAIDVCGTVPAWVPQV